MSSRRSSRVTASAAAAKAAQTAEAIRTARYSDDSSDDSDDDALAPVSFSKSRSSARVKEKNAVHDPFLAMLQKKKESEQQINAIVEGHAEDVREQEELIKGLRGDVGEAYDGTDDPNATNGGDKTRFGNAATSGPARIDDGHCRILYISTPKTTASASAPTQSSSSSSRHRTKPQKREPAVVPTIPAPPTCADKSHPSAKLYQFLTHAHVDRNPDALTSVLTDRIISEFVRLSPTVESCPEDISRWLFGIATTRTGSLSSMGAMHSFAGLLYGFGGGNGDSTNIHSALYGTPEPGPRLVGGVDHMSPANVVYCANENKNNNNKLVSRTQNMNATKWLPRADDWCRVLGTLGVKLDKADADTATIAEEKTEAEQEEGEEEQERGFDVDLLSTSEEWWKPSLDTLDLTVRFLTFCADAMQPDESPKCSELVAMLVLLLLDNNVSEIETSIRAALNAVLYCVVPDNDLTMVVDGAVAIIASRLCVPTPDTVTRKDGTTTASTKVKVSAYAEPLLSQYDSHIVASLVRICGKMPESDRGGMITQEIVRCAMESFFSEAASAGPAGSFARAHKLLRILKEDVKMSVRRRKAGGDDHARETASWFLVLSVIDRAVQNAFVASRKRQYELDMKQTAEAESNASIKGSIVDKGATRQVGTRQDAENAHIVVGGMTSLSGLLNSRYDDMSARVLDYVQLIQSMYLQQSSTAKAVVHSASALGNKKADSLTIKSFFTKHPPVPIEE